MTPTTDHPMRVEALHINHRVAVYLPALAGPFTPDQCRAMAALLNSAATTAERRGGDRNG